MYVYYIYVYFSICYIQYTAAAAAKSLQVCQTLCDPIDGSLPGFSIHGILQARTLEWAAISFSMLACEMCAIVGSLKIVWHCLSLGLE